MNFRSPYEQVSKYEYICIMKLVNLKIVFQIMQLNVKSLNIFNFFKKEYFYFLWFLKNNNSIS